ncbi:hypothetical protein AVEN_249053-1 [Araneus ventricosus]|uniref:Uncharacterized protein n=1 Tax=Araneus ventricosus TaxID=182803 RepID=A0A4Y2WKP1_ARAVE|nr:hypothetical protein AVEN_249053-1 [Araneus ventricosus]
MKEFESDPKYKFLIDFGQWLKRWEKMDSNTGCLTKQTHLAISHTTEAMPALAKYCFDTLNFDYFLPGKIQTDPLEDRFGSYRRLGGTNYNVSIRQIYEGEEKMRIQTILPLAVKSSNYRKLTLSFFNTKNWEDSENECKENLLNTFSISPGDVIAAQDSLPLLTYISGYAAHNLLKKIKCIQCKFTLLIEKELDLNIHNEWISKLDRGGLKYPHPDVVCISQFTFAIVDKLFSSKYEEEFLKCKDHRCLVTAITLDVLDENDIYLGMEECENHNSMYLMKKIVWVIINILLNNFCKKQNDSILKKKLDKKENSKIKKTKQEARKLSTLIK